MSAVKIEIDHQRLFVEKLKDGSIQKSLQDCFNAKDDIEGAVRTLAKMAWPNFDWMYHQISTFWRCKDSPLGWCVYDNMEDRYHDDCLFCHEPEERK